MNWLKTNDHMPGTVLQLKECWGFSLLNFLIFEKSLNPSWSVEDTSISVTLSVMVWALGTGRHTHTELYILYTELA